MKKIIYLLFCFIVMVRCSTKENVDLLIFNARIYCVDDQFSIAEAFAVKGGRFIDVGTTSEIRSKYRSLNEIDMKGAPIYPGFHDAHAHFVSLGKSFSFVNLRGATSYQEVLDRVADYFETFKPEWIVGIGWDQNLWQNPIFPSNEELNMLYPTTPVVLKRIDGHALIANETAIARIGIEPNDPTVLSDEAPIKNGKFTGIFLENIADRFKNAIPEPTEKELTGFILEAAKECYKYGLTSVSDAGLPLSSIELIDKLQQEGLLSLRIDAWLQPSEENFERFKSPYRTEKLTVNCVKLYMDGALGSRGAWMLRPYDDDVSTTGIEVISDDLFMEYCQKAYSAGLQVATHCIGDAAVKNAIKLYANFLKGENDLRWRIEHAQIVTNEDFENFKKYSIVPSVQPTHATSDMFWAPERVGNRIKNGYAYKKLKEQMGWIAFGTDFPIEEVNPIQTFFAAVFRKNLNFEPDSGFQTENALSREDALRAMTIWAAKASFDENLKGSIENGKWADFVVLNKDIMIVDERQIPDTKVVAVFIDGIKMNF
ncbi:MAG: amidohydrolase [Marinilabiliaceae bacterium]|nr:amidohydrolase [Marinilabiliaceae bacterium]